MKRIQCIMYSIKMPLDIANEKENRTGDLRELNKRMLKKPTQELPLN